MKPEARTFQWQPPGMQPDYGRASVSAPAVPPQQSQGGSKLPPTASVPVAGSAAALLMRPRAGGGGPGATSAFPGGPPAVCPSLVLPHKDCNFIISLESLIRPEVSAGVIDIKGSSGRTLLRAQLGNLSDGRLCLSLASVGVEDDPRTRIVAPAPGQQGFELYGRANRFYGRLEPNGGPNTRVLIYEEEHVLSLDFVDPANFQIVARSLADVQLGSSERAPGQGAGWPSEILRLNVRAGVDAVLITSCMLAMVLFQPTARTVPADFARRSVVPSSGYSARRTSPPRGT